MEMENDFDNEAQVFSIYFREQRQRERAEKSSDENLIEIYFKMVKSYKNCIRNMEI